MKVKRLIQILSEFNPNAQVQVVTNDGTPHILVDYGWGGDDSDNDGPRDIEKEKYETTSVSLYGLTESEVRGKRIRITEALDEMHTKCIKNETDTESKD